MLRHSIEMSDDELLLAMALAENFVAKMSDPAVQDEAVKAGLSVAMVAGSLDDMTALAARLRAILDATLTH